jgi:hypothetical protein
MLDSSDSSSRNYDDELRDNIKNTRGTSASKAQLLRKILSYLSVDVSAIERNSIRKYKNHFIKRRLLQYPEKLNNIISDDDFHGFLKKIKYSCQCNSENAVCKIKDTFNKFFQDFLDTNLDQLLGLSIE